MIGPHVCSEELDNDRPCAKRCYSGYSKPVEEQMASICQCMVEEEVIRRTRKSDDKSPLKL